MEKSSLRFCLQMQEVQEDRMHLRRLQELSKIFVPLSSSVSLLHMIAAVLHKIMTPDFPT